MNFYDWMIGKYYGKDTPRGDLAGDMKHEEDGFPKDGDRQRILDYPDGMFACDECIALFKRCWRDYEKAVADEGK